MKIYFIFNNTNWSSIPQKVKNICTFFSPSLIIEPVIIHSSYVDIKWEKVKTVNGINNIPGTADNVANDWYDKNVLPLAIGAEIIVFCISNADKAAHPLCPVGIRGDNDEGAVECTIFGQNENDRVYVNGIDIGNDFEVFAEHEISHALYMIANRIDNTHLYFYNGTPAKVLPELRFINSNMPVFLIRLIKYLQGQLAILLNKQKTMNIAIPVKQENKPDMILKWASAIKIAEGNAPYLMNPGSLKVSPLTVSWGASNGVQASDGGWIAKFETYEKGFDALCNFLILGCHDELRAFHQARTLTAFTKIYAGNPPQGYIDSIIKELGVSGDTLISTFI